MKVVIDTNILVMTITSRSPYHKVYQELVYGTFELLVTTDIVLEYEEIISKKYSPSTSNLFSQLISELPNVQLITSYYKWQIIEKDKDDNKYVDCAISGSADFIVTEDKHFDCLKDISFPKVQVINLETFFQLL
jgi:putative PIN family toxin of toxin-antitoxin system